MDLVPAVLSPSENSDSVIIRAELMGQDRNATSPVFLFSGVLVCSCFLPPQPGCPFLSSITLTIMFFFRKNIWVWWFHKSDKHVFYAFTSIACNASHFCWTFPSSVQSNCSSEIHQFLACTSVTVITLNLFLHLSQALWLLLGKFCKIWMWS